VQRAVAAERRVTLRKIVPEDMRDPSNRGGDLLSLGISCCSHISDT
jgi:hypothetical protein